VSVTRTCGHCGAPFTVRAPSRRGKYCGTTCAGKARSARFAPAPDEADLQWAVAYQDRRVERWAPLVSAAAHSLRRRDRHGIQVLWERMIRADDPASFFTYVIARIAELEDALGGERSTDEEGRAA
jgi:hypothetical protein